MPVLPIRESPLHVVAGVLVDAAGRVLLARRPEGKQLAGCWEFPGGKLDAGETRVAALRRELREELAIDADDIDPQPLISVPCRQGDTHLVLHAHRVRHWRGRLQNREHSELSWCAAADIDMSGLAPADRPVVHAVRLPPRYPITPDTDAGSVHDMLTRALRRGDTLLQLRLPSWPVDAVRDLAAGFLPGLRAAGATLLLNGDIEGARRLGAGTGVHLRAAQLAGLAARPLASGQWVAASCHGPDELRLAQNLADFAVLAPVAPTATHPGAPALGWPAFTRHVAQAALPVYALGGMTPDDLPHARRAGAQGVAGIRAFLGSPMKPM